VVWLHASLAAVLWIALLLAVLAAGRARPPSRASYDADTESRPPSLAL
jgi:hypothetical protein